MKTHTTTCGGGRYSSTNLGPHVVIDSALYYTRGVSTLRPRVHRQEYQPHRRGLSDEPLSWARHDWYGWAAQKTNQRHTQPDKKHTPRHHHYTHESTHSLTHNANTVSTQPIHHEPTQITEPTKREYAHGVLPKSEYREREREKESTIETKREKPNNTPHVTSILRQPNPTNITLTGSKSREEPRKPLRRRERTRQQHGNRGLNLPHPYTPFPHQKYAGEHSFQGDGPHARTHTIGDVLHEMQKAHHDDTWWRDILTDGADGPASAPRSAQFWGDDMSTRHPTTGCRLAIVNAQKKMRTVVDNEEKKSHTVQITYAAELLDEMRRHYIDVLIVSEVGVQDTDPVWGMMDTEASRRGLSMERAASQGTKAAGLAIFMTKDWHRRMVGLPTVYRHKGEARAIHLEFQAKHRKPVERTTSTDRDTQVTRQSNNHLERLHLVGVYGYNNATSTNKNASQNLWSTIMSRIKEARKKQWMHVIVAGDLNATSSTQLDTDATDAETDDEEADSTIISTVTDTADGDSPNLVDVFRNRHPSLQTWTREGSGENSKQRKRRIDMFLTDQQMAKHEHTRTGIHASTTIDSDHMPVWLDIPLDCALKSQSPIPMWSTTKVTKRKMQTPTTQEKAAANEALMNDPAWHNKSDAYAQTKMERLKAAMEESGTVTVKTEVYPKPVTKFKGFNSTHYKIRTWRNRLVRAARVMASHGAPWDPARSMNRFAAVNRALQQIKIPQEVVSEDYKHMVIEPETLGLLQPASIHDAPILMSRTDAIEALQRQAQHITKALNRVLAAETTKRIVQKTKDRETAMNKGDVKTVIRSIFYSFQKRESLEWARRPDGTLAETESELGELTSAKFKKWFESVVPVESRWAPGGTQAEGWEAMMNMDTSKMSNETWNIGGQGQPHHISFADMVTEVYKTPGLDKQAEKEKWWEGVADGTITLEEVKQALQHAKNGTAPGESQLHIGELKILDDENLEVVRAIFDEFRAARRVPDDLNCALLRLLPKTEAGLSDLDKTRPITLIETLTKLYERVIITRVTERLMKHGVLEQSQYGAVPKAGTLPPRRVLGAVFEDANINEKEMHLLLLDLKKAFDTCEYWSQALSWRALGVPEPLVKILLNLDAGSNSPADPHEGPGATTQVILANGKHSAPFPHGRGVRQGSVGGPIKWVVFMHFWLLWVKRTMAGKGYELKNPESKMTAEALAQMFVDDSCWISDKATNAQRLARMCELFCKFHGIMLNKDKCECISMNASGSQVRWIPSKEDPIGRPFEQKGKNGKVKNNDAEDGRWAKYLGVFYEARMRWRKQRAFLDNKLKKLLAPLQTKKMSMEMAIRMINIKVVPAILDGLQVAAVPAGTLQTWDRKLVATVRRAGAIPLGTPPEIYFLPKEMGGMGLASIWDRTSRSRIGNECSALNDAALTDTGTEIPSTLAAVARIAQQHANVPTSWASMVSGDLDRLNMEITTTHPHDSVESAAARDVNKAKSTSKYGPVDIYTDGGTEDMAKGTPRTGWGWSKYTQPDEFDIWDHIGGDQNRLTGEQSNDLGEAMAVLQALRNTHIEDDANLFIDNVGVIQTAGKNRTTDPRRRMKQGGRAMWNRIDALVTARKNAGATTNFEWIHSHVDKPGREKWKASWQMKCACGGQDKGECDLKHRHHQGNIDADERATKGIAMICPRGKQLQPEHGEEAYQLRQGGEVIQGNVWKAISEAITTSRVNEMAHRAQKQDLTKAKEWINQLDQTDKEIRAHICQQKDMNTRFRIRAWSRTLCVYAEEAKKITGTKGEVYGDKLEGGRCRCCAAQPLEDHHHFLTCPSREGLWDDMWRKLEPAWHTEAERHEWQEMRQGWKKDVAGTAWHPTWQRLGMVPESTTKRVMETYPEEKAQQIRKKLKAAAKAMLTTAQTAWKARNDESQKWEQANGITEAKAKMGRRRWKAHPALNPEKKGPKRKPDEEVGTAYAQRRTLKEKRDEYAATKSTEVAEALTRVWQRDRETTARQRQATKNAPWSSVAGWLRQGVSSTRERRKQTTKQPNQGHKTAPAGKCSINYCQNEATTTAPTCKRGDRRCTQHSLIRCIGEATACKCQTESDGKIDRRSLRETREVTVGATIRMRTTINDRTQWIEGEVSHRHMEQRTHRERWGDEKCTYTIDPSKYTRLRYNVTITTQQLMEGGWWIVKPAPTDTTGEDEEPTSDDSEASDWDEVEPEWGGANRETIMKPQKIPTVRDSRAEDEDGKMATQGDERGEKGPTQICVEIQNRKNGKRHREEVAKDDKNNNQPRKILDAAMREKSKVDTEMPTLHSLQERDSPRHVHSATGETRQATGSKTGRLQQESIEEQNPTGNGGGVGKSRHGETPRGSRRNDVNKRTRKRTAHYNPEIDGQTDTQRNREPASSDTPKKRRGGGRPASTAEAAIIMAMTWAVMIDDNDAEQEWQTARPGTQRKRTRTAQEIDELMVNTARKRQHTIAGYYKNQGRGVD